MYRCSLIIILILLIKLRQFESVDVTSSFVTQVSSAPRSLKKETIDVVNPTPARCMPEKQVVKLGPSPDPQLIYTPSCTRVERCGGCCTQDDLLSCQPVDKDIINFRVSVSKYEIGTSKTMFLGYTVVPVERHIKCKCGCILKPENCTVLQEYHKEDCSCKCMNFDERAKCNDAPSNKSWDPHTCTCQCHDFKECQTGHIFNKHTCSCEPQRTLLWFNNLGAYSGTPLPQKK